jgi:hypothetical protein
MDKRHVKSQAALEFLILVGIVLFVFTIMIGVVSSRTTDIYKKRGAIIADDIVTKVQKEVNLASRVLDGYSRDFSIPQKIGKENYSISITGNEVVLSTEKEDFWRIIPNVVGNITKGSNTIRKTNGVIYIN